MSSYRQFDQLDLPTIAEETLSFWKEQSVFQKSVDNRKGAPAFVFYEGPPSANGLPGIHHVMARAIKDIFCRYQTLKGKEVFRKAGWDTHGLPVELGVEKELGITKEDIGKSISVEEYNQACRKAVMKYTDIWNQLTHQMGYWVDTNQPYVTYHNKYIESVWYLLNQIYQKGWLYKGYTIQPYSPAAGTGLSSHELNQPGCYRDVKDTSCVAMFEVDQQQLSAIATAFGVQPSSSLFFLAWTTTPWTLPSNTALAVGKDIDYSLVDTYNPYTFEPCQVILATELIAKHFNPKAAELDLTEYKPGDKLIPYRQLGQVKGKDLLGLRYHQLLTYVQPAQDADKAFHVIAGDFVTTADGTGIVHIAPTFGADDMRVAKEAGIPAMMVPDQNGNLRPLVDLQGRFVPELGELGGKYVKNEYYPDGQAPEKSVDVEISIKLKEMGRAFKVEKYEHSYPHCWRTDKPVLYYPLDSWFIKTTAVKERMIELNQQINWKPESTGTGRFGNWLENLQDWNLSRSRYWGIPIPIWTSADKMEQTCIASVEQLKAEIEKSIAAGIMSENPLGRFVDGDMSDANYDQFDLHRPQVDDVVLVSPSGKPMYREADLIDVWFDSGAMPYAQLHYPFENKELIDSGQAFPADFIAEGVDQTRGWFFTLHAIGTLCFDNLAFKAVVSNGLVLDKNGQKMSKRLGNAIDPFETLKKYGADATRWYMISNAQPWENLKFDLEGIAEVQRKFFRALYNTYSFFALYANIDQLTIQPHEKAEPVEQLDRWILAKLNQLVLDVDDALASYDPTAATRLIQDFVVDQLSNWYVRLSRRRFWKGEMTADKKTAYLTLYHCLETVSKLMSPVAPFFADWLYRNLHPENPTVSVHLTDFPQAEVKSEDESLIESMEMAQSISSMILALRKKSDIKVRQPLSRCIIPVIDAEKVRKIETVKHLILSETNIKTIEFVGEESGMFSKTVKANFKTLGPKYGKHMKAIAQEVAQFTQDQIRQVEAGELNLMLEGERVTLTREDVEIHTNDIPGWLMASERGLSVALDISLTEELIHEGLARELVNRVQTLRKESGLEVTDKIVINIAAQGQLASALENNKQYICAETLSSQLIVVETLPSNHSVQIEVEEGVQTAIHIEKLN
ncbi:MAG TPA: isoleucine--tRNA ligase [Luteibaculaceae bacterium]|nr:isoleucine--tRNA ligase [Luteibaculaceae bacterium]